MTKRDKLLAGVCNNPKAVRFDDACRADELLGFKHKGGQGSHRAFAKQGEPELLNFQDRNGCSVPYQTRQLIRMIERYNVDKISD
jgi:hypothetical protein